MSQHLWVGGDFGSQAAEPSLLTGSVVRLLLPSPSSALVGGVGNGAVDSGIDESIDIMFFNMKTMLYKVDDLMARMTAVTEGTEAGDMLVEVVAEGRLQIQCLDNDIKVMEADLDEAKDTALSLRSLVTTVVIAIPLVIAVSLSCDRTVHALLLCAFACLMWAARFGLVWFGLAGRRLSMPCRCS